VDKKAASRAMQSCEYLYLCGARHLFRKVYLDIGLQNFSLQNNQDTRKGLFRKMIQWTLYLELKVPDTPEAQKSFFWIAHFLKSMALGHLEFLSGSQLSVSNHEKLLQKLESGTRLRKSIRAIRFPGLTHSDAVALKPSPDGTMPVMDLKLDIIFASVQDSKLSIRMTSEGHLAHDGKIANGTPKNTTKSLLQPYAHSTDWQGSITIEGHDLDPHSTSMFGNAIQDVGLGSPDRPAQNIPVIQFREVNFSRLNPMIFRSIDWFRVKRLELHECADLMVLFFYILISSSRIGIQELTIENHTRREQYIPNHPHNIDHFLGDWDELLAISITTSVRWPLPLGVLSNHSNLTSVHYDIGLHDVNMEWLDNLVQYNPHVVKLHISCHDISDCLMGIGAEFEDPECQFQMMDLATRLVKLRCLRSLTLNLRFHRHSFSHPALDKFGHLPPWDALALLMLPFFIKASKKSGFPDQTITEIQFAKKLPTPTSATPNDSVAQTVIACNIPQLVQLNEEYCDTQRRKLDEAKKYRAAR
jgi:hypothetical protein